MLRKPGHWQGCLWDAPDGAHIPPGLSMAPGKQARGCYLYHVLISQMNPAFRTRLAEMLCQLLGQSQLFCAFLLFLSFPV